MIQPQSFHGAPTFDTRQQVPVTPIQQMPVGPVLPRSVPTLTVYADGLVNLNGDATRALGAAAAVMLLPPTTPGTRWQLLPRRTTAGALVLAGRTDRVGFARFRSATLAAALYAALPCGFVGPLYLEMSPSAEAGFDLVAQSCATIAGR